MLAELLRYLEYPFVRYAIVAAMLISLCSALVGVILVLKRYSYIGDGLSHVAFGAMSIALVLGMIQQKMYLVFPITTVAAILILKSGQNKRVQGDAIVGMVSTGALALGYLLMNLFPPTANISGDVCSTLFGSTSILTLSKAEVWLCVIASIIVLIIFVMLYPKIFAVTFDENFSKATGLKADQINLILAVIIAVIVVLAMNLVGSLLISALVIFPALSVMQLFKSFKAVLIGAAVLSEICTVTGMLVAILCSTPVGATIVTVDIIAFIICWLIRAMKA
ncbi:iron chelate uptake ABC transporter family permease subunit [Solobacterium sp.]|jgi:ABC-3 protein|uniref:metal ABC transporter permease n=1 Tax=Solobacterium sp. TaxID=2060878 RepID=UPI001CB1F162|nr:iron chelate uptake ABC transporter family permease subunit [Solobacterium sp.]MBF1077433.1 metal ABC transporter permease [Solobacterium sp.]MBF1084220.1 metal ABC transporter permease [Solobacterium sp.]MBF1085955.1 metal ABC transporter permease [Solobacterium sp.]MBF1088717.1 metal ABC transporter permease [Solobacterium sp.]MBF1090909.1 metal ABC transporter permease [Solobacterium sp.]